MNSKILIRFDDLCPTMNYKQWGKAVEILDKYNVKPLLGIIPDCQDPELQIEQEHLEFWEDMQKLQKRGYTLAMHGCYHICKNSCHGIVNYTLGSEFAGYDYETQYEKIAYGKKVFERNGIYTDIFFAPRHSYDKNTLKALAANGFKYISDGKSNKPILREGIICIPCRSTGCPRIGKKGYYTAVFHTHEWEKIDKAEEYEQLKKLCTRYKDSIVGFDFYSKRKTGIYLIQILDEKIFLIWKYKFKPFLRKIILKLFN